jgi:hypothetical protein
MIGRVYTRWYSFTPLLLEALAVYKPEKVIEWGMGLSTAIVAWCPEVKEMHSFEHDRDWFKRFSNKYPRHIHCHYIPLGKGYSVAGNKFTPQTFDFAIIDGVVRTRCIRTAKSLVKVGGIIMLHDFDSPVYKETYEEGIKFFTKVKELYGTVLMINRGDVK